MDRFGKLTTLVITATVLLFVAQAPAYGADDPEYLVEAAWNSSPSVSALDAKIEAANQRVPQAGVWADPVIAVEYSNVPVDSFALGDHAMSGVQLRLQQTFPFPGKTHFRKQAAAARAEVSDHELDEKKNQLRGMVKRAYWNLALVRSLKKITEQNISEVETLIAGVTGRYEVGGAGQQDILRLKVLRDRLVDELADFDRSDLELTATLNAMLNRTTGTVVVTPEKVYPAQPDITIADAYQRAEASRPLLALWNAQAKANSLTAQKAGHEGWPDPTLWVGYRFRREIVNDQGMVADEGVDFFSAGLSFPVPLTNHNKWGAAKKESLAAKRSALQNRDALALDIRSELERALADWQRAFDRAKTYDTVIAPGQKQTLDATLAAYRVGRSDFTSLYAAQVGLLDAQRALVRARCETRIQQANVENLIGENIPKQGGAK